MYAHVQYIVNVAMYICHTMMANDIAMWVQHVIVVSQPNT